MVDALLTVLENATDLNAYEHDGGRVSVNFDHGVESAQRATLWSEGTTVHLGMWAGELMPQYARLYGNPDVLESLAALEDKGWILRANFHLAFHNSNWKQRWYPANRMPAPVYLWQWATDLPNAGRFSRYEVENPNFIRWLVERGYITDAEVSGLIIWLRGLSRQQVDVRPSLAIERSWDSEPDPAEVRDAINEVLTALDEPRLGQQRRPEVAAAPAPVKRAAKAPAKKAVKKPTPPGERPVTPCPNCFVALPATGVCDCG